MSRRNNGSQSEVLKRRATGSCVDLEHFLIFYIIDETFSVVTAKQIIIDESNDDLGMVSISMKKYKVKILCRGLYIFHFKN